MSEKYAKIKKKFSSFSSLRKTMNKNKKKIKSKYNDNDEIIDETNKSTMKNNDLTTTTTTVPKKSFLKKMINTGKKSNENPTNENPNSSSSSSSRLHYPRNSIRITMIKTLINPFIRKNSQTNVSNHILNGDCNQTLIMSNEYIKDSKQKWHMEHFNCIYCQRSLTTARYALTESNDNNDNDDNNNCNNNNGKPMCIECYEQRHSNVCEECQKPIGVNTKDLSFNDRHWHEKCFVCSQCKFDLFDKPFGSRSDQIFCANCYDNTFAPRCCYCAEIFEPGQRKLDFRDKLYHDSCFCCKKCQIPIGTKTFLQKNNNIYCSECYKNVFATRCIKCCEIIINDGIQYRDEPWHASCFRCVECQKELSNIPFTSHDDRPYCRQCNANLFAPKCDICKQPIIGSTGRKMITHGNHKWHQSCFKCKDCSTELGGKGFVPLDNDGNGEENIYCTPCAQVIIAKQWTKQSTQNQQSKQQQQEEQQQDQHQQEQEQDQQSDDSV
ncbi:four and a half LIM domains protein 2-like isoform X2 [Dermatophagoides pteronyssinus]|uniref:four and a half LIM domains protein 2-like isoform X2 n=1 Tax=Dermatophagoides pteronyssinus TaxID=6956 RepID=UPI003F666825